MQKDPYPAVRDIAGRSLVALLSGHPRAQAQARRFVATAGRGGRRAIVDAVTGALPTGAVSAPDPTAAAALRAQAAQVAIEIGE